MWRATRDVRKFARNQMSWQCRPRHDVYLAAVTLTTRHGNGKTRDTPTALKSSALRSTPPSLGTALTEGHLA
jgi:hypothetical protein